jgi:hypothetical protein
LFELTSLADGKLKVSVIRRTDDHVAVDVATDAPSLAGAALAVAVTDGEGRDLARGRIELTAGPRATGSWLLPDDCLTREMRVSVEVAQ